MKKILFTMVAGSVILWNGGGCVRLDNNAELAARIETLETEIADFEEFSEAEDQVNLRELFEIYNAGGQLDPSLARRYVKLVQLPENPTKDQIKDYLQKMAIFSNYLQYDLFKAEVISQLRKGRKLALTEAIPRMNNDQLYRYIVEGLFTEEDKPLLIPYLKTPNAYPAFELFQKFANASDCDLLIELLPYNHRLFAIIEQLSPPEEKLLPTLTKELLKGRYFNYYDQWLNYVMRNLNHKEREKFIREFWSQTAQADNSNTRSRNIMLQLASYGFIPAFKQLMMRPELLKPDTYSQNRLVALTPCKNFSELQEWYESNKGGEPYFDKDRNIYDFRAKSPTNDNQQPAN